MCYAWGAWELRSVWPTCKEKGCYLYSLKLITKLGLHVRLNLFIIEYGKGVWIRLQLFACPTQPLPNWSTAGTTTYPNNSNSNNNNNNNCNTWSQLPLHSIGFVSLFKPTMHSRADPPKINSSCERKFLAPSIYHYYVPKFNIQFPGKGNCAAGATISWPCSSYFAKPCPPLPSWLQLAADLDLSGWTG